MSLDLVRQITSVMYSEHEILVVEALLAHYADGDDSVSVDEIVLNDVVNFKPRTLRAALGKLQQDQLLHTQMVRREDEKYAIRRWVLNLAEFERVVRARIEHIRNELTAVAPQPVAYCEPCNRPAAVDELHASFSCVVCGCALTEPPSMPGSTAADFACLDELQQFLS